MAETMSSITLATDTCAYCSRAIVADLDEQSMLDWGDDGDYGCGGHPLNDSEGTYGHQPSSREALTWTMAVRALFTEGLRGEQYIGMAQHLASQLGLAYKPPLRYDRVALVEVLIHHWSTPISRCTCGWAKLGHSWPEHVADMYEAALAGTAS